MTDFGVAGVDYVIPMALSELQNDLCLTASNFIVLEIMSHG